MISSVTLTKSNIAKRLSVSGKTLVETTVYRTPTDGEFRYKMTRNVYLSKGWKVSIKQVRPILRRVKKHTEPIKKNWNVMNLPFKEELK